MTTQWRWGFSAERKLAQSMTERLKTALPSAQMETKRHILSVNKVTRQLEQIYDLAKTHQAQLGLGFFRRAYLANQLKWQLQEQGYPKDFVDMAIEGLLVELAKRTGTKT